MPYKDKAIASQYFREYRKKNLEAYKARANAYYAKNGDKMRARSRELTLKWKTDAISHYGGACVCCGEGRLVFLSIDHIFGDGKAHRKKIGGGGPRLYQWLKKNNYPSGFRALCMNCNWAAAHGGCPHEGAVRNLQLEKDVTNG
jgi:hypothetical protein